MRAHRKTALDTGERLGRAHRDDGHLAAARLDELERELEAVLVAGVERAVAGVTDQEVVGSERRGARRVGDEFREHGHVHAADATQPAEQPEEKTEVQQAQNQTTLAATIEKPANDKINDKIKACNEEINRKNTKHSLLEIKNKIRIIYVLT